MAVKKAVAAKKAPAKKTSAKKVANGDAYECKVCGVEITVDQACGCDADYHEIICCGKTMKKK